MHQTTRGKLEFSFFEWVDREHPYQRRPWNCPLLTDFIILLYVDTLFCFEMAVTYKYIWIIISYL